MDHKLRESYFAELEKEIKELIDNNTRLLSKDYSAEIDCPLCEEKKNNHDELFIKNGYTFVRCKNCGMIFTNPQVKGDLLNELYGKSKANDIWVELQESKTEQLWKKEYYLDQIKLISDFSKLSDINLLDIGCSTGYFLQNVIEAQPKWQTTGLELSKKAYNYALNKKLNVRNDPLNNLSKTEKFNVFTLFGVLEHLPRPHQILDEIKQYSEEKTYILAIVPNIYSLYHMFIQEKSVSLDGRNHLLYFSEKTLKKLFVDNGFEIIKLDTVLTGLDNIKRQMQWFDPYVQINSTDFIPDQIKCYFESNEIEKFIYQNNLGLRLRVLAKYKK